MAAGKKGKAGTSSRSGSSGAAGTSSRGAAGVSGRVSRVPPPQERPGPPVRLAQQAGPGTFRLHALTASSSARSTKAPAMKPVNVPRPQIENMVALVPNQMYVAAQGKFVDDLEMKRVTGRAKAQVAASRGRAKSQVAASRGRATAQVRHKATRR